jgi:Transcriptional regulator PadR-like family
MSPTQCHGTTSGDAKCPRDPHVFTLGENSYGMTIHEQVEKLAEGERTVSLGSCYITLDRLEQQGYVKSWFSDPRRLVRIVVLGGWTRYRLYYLVMVVKIQPLRARPRRA